MEDFGNLVYESKTYNIYRNGKNAYKIFNSSVKKSHVLQEAINQTLAEETSISVPKIYQVSPNQNDEWMISYEFVEGLSLNTLIDKHPEKQDMYIDYMIKLQTKIFNENAYSFNSFSLGCNLTIIFLSLGLRVLIFILGEFPSIKYC